MNLNITSHIKTVKHLVTANSPALLVGTAIVGVITTGVLAAKGGYKARGLVDEAEEAKGEALNVQEKFHLTWLCYAVPAVTGASAIAATVGVHTIHTKRHAALTGLYAVASNRFDEYTEQAETALGAKKSQTMNNEVAQKHVDGRPVESHGVVMVDSAGTELCFDDWTGRYFMGSMALIDNAFHELNLTLLESGDASLNDFYDHLGLDPIPFGDDFGWSGEKVNGRFGSVIASDGRPAISVWFHKNPQPGKGRK